MVVGFVGPVLDEQAWIPGLIICPPRLRGVCRLETTKCSSNSSTLGQTLTVEDRHECCVDSGFVVAECAGGTYLARRCEVGQELCQLLSSKIERERIDLLDNPYKSACVSAPDFVWLPHTSVWRKASQCQCDLLV